MKKIFDWFESQIEPYPSEDPERPPNTLYAFCRHYTKGMEFWLIMLALTSALIALTEVLLFSFMGSIIDWLSQSDPKTFIANEWPSLLFMGLVVVIARPLMSAFGSLVLHQTFLGNFPMRIRWNVHNYLIRQSMSYFQDEFAGRIATKLMQTSLAVRETVMKVLDILVYVVTYFLGILFVTLAADWRMMLPFLVWVGAYTAAMRYFVPRMRKISAEQADARSLMTGRVVDSYTNIATVKLFSHSNREQSYAKESMDMFLNTVHRQMRLSSGLEICITLMNSFLFFTVAAIGIGLWMNGEVMPGAVAVALGIILRIWGMSHWIMWEMAALFENIGTVQDGINSISLPRLVSDKPNAKPLPPVSGDISFNDVTFNYGGEKGVIEKLNLTVHVAKKLV